MVASCAAFGCTNTRKKCPKTSFHIFPLRNKALLHKWVVAVGRVDHDNKPWMPTKNHRLCSDHFVGSDFQLRPGAEFPLLKETAVPSKFPKHLRSKKLAGPRRKLCASQDANSTVSAASANLPNPEPKRLNASTAAKEDSGKNAGKRRKKIAGFAKKTRLQHVKDTELAAQALLAMSSNNSSEVVQTTPDIGVSVVDKFISVGSQSESVSVRHWQTQTLTPPQKNENRDEITPGYTGLFFLFHPKSKKARVEWIRPAISDKDKVNVVRLLINLLSGNKCRRLPKPTTKGSPKAGSASVPQHVPDSKDGLISSDTDSSSRVVTEEITAKRQSKQESGQLPNVEKGQLLVKPGIISSVDGSNFTIADSTDQLSGVEGNASVPQHVPDSKDDLISSDNGSSSEVVTQEITAEQQTEQESGQLPNVEKAQLLVKPGIIASVDASNFTIADSTVQLSGVEVELVYPCPVCPLKFPSKAELSKHKLGHRKSGVECKTCGKRLSSMVYLKTHMMTHTGEKPHHCTFCNKQFIQRVHLKRHLVTHTKVKDFSCSVCPKRFASRTELSNHMCIHTGERRHLCAVCGKGFIIKRHLMLHEKTHCQRECDTCGKVLYSNKAAVFHAMTHAEKSHQCHICHQKFGKKGALALHVKKHERLGEIPQSKLELSAQQAKVSSAQQIEEELSAQQIEEELSAQQIEELSTQQIEELSAQRVEEELAVGFMLEITDSA